MTSLPSNSYLFPVIRAKPYISNIFTGTISTADDVIIMPARRTYTRMEKKVLSDTEIIPALLDTSPGHLFQLEGGLEECQIKRIVFSGSNRDGSDNDCISLKFGLVQDNTPDFNLEDIVIYSMLVTNNAVSLINETTTVRVPRGWYLVVWAETIAKINLGAGEQCVGDWHLQLNYKVLS